MDGSSEHTSTKEYAGKAHRSKFGPSMGNAAKSQRRPRVATCAPLTEQQLADVRRAVDNLSGSAARSVKCHGLVVYLDKNVAAAQIHKFGAQLPPGGAAKSRKPDNELNARERRSRRRLDKRIALNAAKMQERPPMPHGGEIGLAATHAATECLQDAPANPFAEFLAPPSSPANKCPAKSVMPQTKPPPSTHPGQPASRLQGFFKPRGSKGSAEGSSAARGQRDPTTTAWPSLAESRKPAGGKQAVQWSPRLHAYHDGNSSKGPDYPASSQAPREPPRRQPTSTRRSTS